METELKRQGLCLLMALLLGAALGLGYDVLRPPRRRGGRFLETALDCLFCAVSGCAVFAYAMGAENGRLGLWELTSVLAGFLLYMATLSGPVLKLLTGMTDLLCAWAAAVKSFLGRGLLLTKKALAAVGQWTWALLRWLRRTGPPEPGEDGETCRKM